MNITQVRRTFAVMHVTLGIVVVFDSIRTAVLASSAADPNIHLVILASVEAIGALLFLVPAWTRLGGAILLATFVVALFAHAVSGEFPTPLLVYAATTMFVMAHGPVRARGSSWRLSHS